MDNLLYVQTAHNIVVTLDVNTLECMQVNSCKEKSILYSGTIYSNSNGDVLVAAGTVLGGVVIWSLYDEKVLHRMTTHEGSIFGVKFSPCGTLLASCSDDRAIKVWNMSSGKEVATGWGHSIRIWDLHFIGSEKIVSMSEDCTARVWKISGNKLICEQILEGHSGRSVWCGSVTSYNSRLVLATGGGDGRVRLWDLSRYEHCQIKKSWTLEEVDMQCSSAEVFKQYFYSLGCLLASTSTARIFCLLGETWSEIDCGDFFEQDSYSVVNGWKNTKYGCVGIRSGRIYIVDMLEAKLLHTLQVKLRGKLVGILTFSLHDEPFLLTQSKNPSDPFVVISTDGSLSLSLIPPPSFLTTSIHYDSATGILYLGSRHGALATYRLSMNSFEVDDAINPLNCWRRIMTEDTITSITALDSAKLLLTSRIGHFATLLISAEGKTVTYKTLSFHWLNKGVIEGSAVVNNKVILYGFRNDIFFIWNESDQYEVMTDNCGGSHRCWYLDISDRNEGIYNFMYTRASSLCLLSSSLDNVFTSTNLQPGTHGREVRSIAFSPREYGAFKVVATISEDTNVMLSTIDEFGLLSSRCTQKKHVSGMQSLHWTPDGKYLLSSAAREELVVWKVEVDLTAQFYVLSRCSLPTSTDLPDLRIMDFALYPIEEDDKYLLVTVYSDSAIKIWILDVNIDQFTLLSTGHYTECCILGCTIQVVEDLMYLIINPTDGHLVIWSISPILKSSNLKLKDGKLYHTGPSELSTFPGYSLRLQVHQSGIKSSLIYPISSSTFAYISCGDDNTIKLVHITFSDGSICAEKIHCAPDAHSSTITGLCKMTTDNQEFVSVGVDQQLRLWRISPCFQSIELIESTYSTVADLGTVDICRYNDTSLALVGGSGISSWKIN